MANIGVYLEALLICEESEVTCSRVNGKLTLELGDADMRFALTFEGENVYAHIYSLTKSENDLVGLIDACPGWDRDFDFDFNLKIKNPTPLQIKTAAAVFAELVMYL